MSLGWRPCVVVCDVVHGSLSCMFNSSDTSVHLFLYSRHRQTEATGQRLPSSTDSTLVIPALTDADTTSNGQISSGSNGSTGHNAQRHRPILMDAMPEDLVGPSAPRNEGDRFKIDLSYRPEDVTPLSSAYNMVPVEEFGAAVLRGMGWQVSHHDDDKDRFVWSVTEHCPSNHITSDQIISYHVISCHIKSPPITGTEEECRRQPIRQQNNEWCRLRQTKTRQIGTRGKCSRSSPPTILDFDIIILIIVCVEVSRAATSSATPCSSS